MGTVRQYVVGQEVPSVTKAFRQERINLFEASGGKTAPNIHNDVEAAKKTIGLDGPMASGRMSIASASECLRRFFGEDVYNHTGMVDLRNLRPVRAGDTVTVHAKIVAIDPVSNGQHVRLELTLKNQRGETTSAGEGGAIVPSGYL